MTETLFDFSKKISDYEFITEDKIKDLKTSIQIEKVFVHKINDFLKLQDFLITFPNKQFFFTITIYGGGSSGIKLTYDSKVAYGGYSSGTIIRFPIEINNNQENHFALIRIGTGGDSFKIEDKVLINNGEYSNFDLYRGVEEIAKNSFQTSRGRKNSSHIEGLSSYGSGKLLDNSIIEEVSTLSYFGFKGSNSTNTSPLGFGEHRNYYSPYINQYNGYNSLNGLGGDYLGEIDGEINTGAGGAGVFNNSSDRVGKGADGGCIIEYEGDEKINVYAVNFLLIESQNNKIVFIIYDQGSGSRDLEIEFPSGIYYLNYFISFLKEKLNETMDANVMIENDVLVIRMNLQWTVDLGKSSDDMITIMGIKNTDMFEDNQIKKSVLINGSYTIPFSNSIYSVCLLENFYSQRVYI
jgi:hypothetical protein